MSPTCGAKLNNFLLSGQTLRGREKRKKWEELELGFFSPNGFAFLTVEGGSGQLQAILKQCKDFCT